MRFALRASLFALCSGDNRQQYDLRRYAKAKGHNARPDSSRNKHVVTLFKRRKKPQIMPTSYLLICGFYSFQKLSVSGFSFRSFLVRPLTHRRDVSRSALFFPFLETLRSSFKIREHARVFECLAELSSNRL